VPVSALEGSIEPRVVDLQLLLVRRTGVRGQGVAVVCDRRREDGFTVSTCGARSLAHVSRWSYVPASSGADSFPFSFPPLSKVLFLF
jgi:hypothetical protein